MRIKFAIITLVLVCFTSVSMISQELYEPRNIKHAYENETRARSGEPGENYWQNRATYAIKFEVMPPDRKVKGSEKIVYTNNSPDTLKRLNFKLIINHHKPNVQRARSVPENYLTSGMHIDEFKVNGEERDWKTREIDGTNKFIKLDEPLLPGKDITLQIDWHYEVSKKSGREGAISPTAYFLGYAYPRVAVYDDYEGWDVMPHTMAQEFYNDFNDYTFEVSVPKDFLVWGTGELQNPEEVLEKAFVEKFEESKTSDEIVHIVTQEDLDKGGITRHNDSITTWKWKADNVTDIAFAVSNHYKWDAGSVKIGDRQVTTQSAYNADATDFEQMVEFIKHSLKWFSENFPGVDYPYPAMTVVRGFADMEFPMMANDSSMPTRADFTRFVAEHEIAHTYFPFYMGTNETRFGFMDEGWAVTMEHLISIADIGEKQVIEDFKGFRVKNWINDPSFEQDLPIITPTNVLSGKAMSNNEYGKPALAYLALRDMLGEEKFDKVLRGYMERWEGKHPMPWDFFYSFNDLSGENLNWFWKRWFFSNNYIDYAIDQVEVNGDEAVVTIENIGGFAAPFDLEIMKGNGTKRRIHQSPEIWKENKEKVKITIENIGEMKTITLDGGIFMDADLSDNTWEG